MDKMESEENIPTTNCNETSSCRQNTTILDEGMCSPNLQTYVYVFVCLALLAFVCCMCIVLFNLLNKHRRGKADAQMISCFAVCQLAFGIVHTIVMFTNQFGQCGWIEPSSATCKFLWWLKSSVFMTSNYYLVLLTYQLKNTYLGYIPKLFILKLLHIGHMVWVTGLVAGTIMVPYLIFTETEYSHILRGKSVIAASFCTIDARHDIVLEVFEFLVGGVLPIILAYIVLFQLFFKTYSDMSRRHLKTIKSVYDCASTSNKNTDAEETEPTSKNQIVMSHNVTFSLIMLCGLLLHTFLQFSPRLFEFVMFFWSYKCSLLVMGRFNDTNLSEDAWTQLTTLVTLLPLLYCIALLPMLWGQSQGVRSLPYFCGKKKHHPRPIKRQRPIRGHVNGHTVPAGRQYSVGTILDQT